MTGHDRRAREQCGHVCRRPRLAGVWPQRLQVGSQDPVRPHQALDAECGREVGRVEQTPQVGEGEHEHPQHPVGAVDEGEAFLLGQLDRGEPVFGERLGGGANHTLVVDHITFAHHGQGTVREGRQVAGAAEAAVLENDRCEAGIQQVGVGLGSRESHSGVTRAHRREPQQHQRAHHLDLDAGTGAGGVGADEALLQTRSLRGGDVPRGERTEAGRDAVDRGVGRRQVVDMLASPADRLARLRPDGHPCALARDAHHVVGSQRPDVNDHVHDSMGLLRARFR